MYKKVQVFSSKFIELKKIVHTRVNICFIYCKKNVQVQKKVKKQKHKSRKVKTKP